MSDHKFMSLSGRGGDEGQAGFKRGQCSVVLDTLSPPTQLGGSLVPLGSMAASLGSSGTRRGITLVPQAGSVLFQRLLTYLSQNKMEI